eukprot:11129506-Alexandrium_andersonii.AAC.1
MKGAAGSATSAILRSAGHRPIAQPFQNQRQRKVNAAFVPSTCANAWREAWHGGLFDDGSVRQS